MIHENNEYLYTGVDIGQSGSIVTIKNNGTVLSHLNFSVVREIIYSKKTNIKKTGLINKEEIIEHLKKLPKKNHKLIIESPITGFSGNLAAEHMLTIGYNYGIVLEAIKDSGIPFQIIHPISWISKMVGITKGKRDKGKNIKAAENLLKPKDKEMLINKNGQIHEGAADAFLLAAYLLRNEKWI